MVCRSADDGSVRCGAPGGGLRPRTLGDGAGVRSIKGGVWRLAAIGILAAVSMGGSCRQPTYISEYERLTGCVTALPAETSELTVQLIEPAAAFGKSGDAACLVTNDAEIYINDRFVQFDSIVVGDTVELVGYREHSPRGERFIVCLANIARTEPLPPAPDLLSAISRPSATP